MGLTNRSAGQTAFTMFGTAGNIHEDLSDEVLIQGAVDTPFLNDIGFSGPRPTDKYHKWSNDDYDVFTVTLGAAIEDTDGTSVTLAANGLDIEEGTLLEVEDEILLVTASSSATALTVGRGACGSTAATHDNSTTCYVVGQATYDNTEFPTAKMDTRTVTGNYLQQFLVPVEVDNISELLDTVGSDNEVNWQKEKKLAKALRLLELAALRSNKDSSSPQGSSSVPGTMVGLRNLISTNSTSGSSARLTEALLRTALGQCDDYGGSPDTIALTKFDKGLVNSWNVGRVRFDSSEAKTGRQPISYFVSQYGTQKFLPCRNVRAGEAYIYPAARVKLCPLMPFSLVEFSKISTSTRLAIWGVYTLEFKAEKHASKLTSLATT